MHPILAQKAFIISNIYENLNKNGLSVSGLFHLDTLPLRERAGVRGILEFMDRLYLYPNLHHTKNSQGIMQWQEIQ